MAPPKAWFKRLNPESEWDRVSLEEVEYVTDLKDVIKAKASPDLDAFSTSRLTLSATVKVDDAGQAVRLDARKGLASTLRDFSVEVPDKKDIDSIQKSFAENIWLFVSAPAVAGIKYKQNIDNAFPNGLKYVPPQPLLKTDGLAWNFQATPSLHKILRTELMRHYEYYLAKKFDKGNMPIYLFFSGAGTGKSRCATEFQRTAIECLEDDHAELKNRLQNAWVFLVSLENGTPLTELEVDTMKAIGSRMLHQLHPDKQWLDILDEYESPNPWRVLDLVAKYEGRALEDASIILVVDGMQNLLTATGNRLAYKEGLNRESRFSSTLASIAALSQQGTFLIPCCTATVIQPAQSLLYSDTGRLRVYLPVTSLEPPTILRDGMQEPVFQMDTPLVKLMVSDCGGHGRALEVLEKVLRNVSIDELAPGTLMHMFREELSRRYGHIFKYSAPEVRAILRAALIHQPLDAEKFLPGTDLKPSQVAIPGLVRFTSDNSGYGYLTISYIWLWAVVEGCGGSLLPQWWFDDYDEHLSRENKTLDSRSLSWQNFERFNALFRCIKSAVLEEGEQTSIEILHRGAHLEGNIGFKNHHLELDTASAQVDTRSNKDNSKEWIVECELKNCDVRQHTHCIINAAAAASGDAFLSLDATRPMNEVHQYKLLEAKAGRISQKVYEAERKKSASNDDFFLLFTTQDKCNVKLPNLSGIVDRDNWQSYFGPFAGRAYIYGVEGPLNINEVTFTSLQLVNGISAERARQIISKRPFASVEKAVEETSIPEKILKKFRYC